MRHSASLGRSEESTSLAAGTELKLTSLAEHMVIQVVTRHTQTRAPAQGTCTVYITRCPFVTGCGGPCKFQFAYLRYHTKLMYRFYPSPSDNKASCQHTQRARGPMPIGRPSLKPQQCLRTRPPAPHRDTIQPNSKSQKECCVLPYLSTFSGRRLSHAECFRRCPPTSATSFSAACK